MNTIVYGTHILRDNPENELFYQRFFGATIILGSLCQRAKLCLSRLYASNSLTYIIIIKSTCPLKVILIYVNRTHFKIFGCETIVRAIYNKTGIFHKRWLNKKYAHG